MIDIHSHILPNIDDGARNIEETLAMLKEAYMAGFTSIFATSHYMEGSSYHSNKEERIKLVEELKSKVKEKGIPLDIVVGTEAYICYDLIDLIKNNEITTLGDSKYVLFELPLNAPKPVFVEELIFELQSAGYVPVLAHPERYDFVQEDPNVLIEWIDRGALIQSNYASIIGRYGKRAQKTVKKLLEHNMVHLLGTDAHRKESIYLEMDVIKKQLSKILDQDAFDILSQENPEKIMKNEEIYIDDPIRIKRGLFGS